MIEITGLSKKFGTKQALSDVSFVAENGKVTGFLGPNGAGKSTTMRAALGLIHPDTGQALVDGERYVTLRAPMQAVGAVLDAKSAHKARTAYDHLRTLAYTNNIPKSRVDEVIDMTGLGSVKNRKAGQFSLGMSQRLSIAGALLGDPKNLVLDEPINGLDPEGVKWVRELCRYYAGQGRAVLLSSHLMSEVALTADNLVVIGQGRVLETGTVSDFVAKHSGHSIRVTTPEPDKLRAIAARFPGARLEVEGGSGSSNSNSTPPQPGANAEQVVTFHISDVELHALARACASVQLVTYELREEHASLEEAYMELTHSSVEYAAAQVPNAQNASQSAFQSQPSQEESR
ncbi:ATP-binding cassette domain-containing protein [Bifidobacterium panos]|uniref:Multidrug ABC transporter ATP-binding protein n=1 Tax=Bifidobacterium panos TaxID=2675321 RepID=A0ABX1SZW0_9BIFI|nr:ATP-binding cassette domain-containing protein [Bifidobacterium sp. DSM 109963]NMN01943.1 multidrug ABC transporter ATP-binding protein [Bifidobacterium sp. DSM 109963]